MGVLFTILAFACTALWFYWPQIAFTIEIYIWIGIGLIVLMVGLVPWDKRLEVIPMADDGNEQVRYVLGSLLFVCYVLAILIRLAIHFDVEI